MDEVQLDQYETAAENFASQKIEQQIFKLSNSSTF